MNNLVGHAATEGECGPQRRDPWRRGPSRTYPAFLVALEVDRAAVHNEAFNVGRNEENYRIREVAEIVHRTVEDSAISFAPGAGPDQPQRRVSFDKLAAALPGFRPQWTVDRGACRCWTRCAVTASPPRFVTRNRTGSLKSSF